MFGTESHPGPAPTTDALAELRQKVRALEGFRPAEDGGGFQFGIPEIDAALPGGYLPTGVNHEFLCDSREGAAATCAFLCALLPNLPRAPLVWISKERQLYAPGLGCYDLDARDIYVAQVANDREALWAMEEALRCKGLAAVIAETGDADMTATRRLQLAAEGSGVTGFLLRHTPRNSFSTACVTRWKITPAPGISDGLLGLGNPAWQVELCRARGGRPGSWTVSWRPEQGGGKFRLAGKAGILREAPVPFFGPPPSHLPPARRAAFAYA